MGNRELNLFSGIKFRRMLIAGMILFVFHAIQPAYGQDDAQQEFYFTKIYVDGIEADSEGIKILLRASERHAGAHFQPYVVDVDFILEKNDEEIFSDKTRQVSVGGDIGGTVEISRSWKVALDEEQDYTAHAVIYLYESGSPEYFTEASSNFTAIMDAAITDIYGDSIGASATVKGESMVPLDAKIVFTLRQGDRILEKKESRAPYIMSNDREKTVDILWDNNLPPGPYLISAELIGKDIIARYDKTITVEKQITSSPATTPPPPSITGFSYILGFTALFVTILAVRNKK